MAKMEVNIVMEKEKDFYKSLMNECSPSSCSMEYNSSEIEIIHVANNSNISSHSKNSLQNTTDVLNKDIQKLETVVKPEPIDPLVNGDKCNSKNIVLDIVDGPSISSTVKKSSTSNETKSELTEIIQKWKDFSEFNADDEKIQQKIWKTFENSDLSYTSSRNCFKFLQKLKNTMKPNNVFKVLKEIRDQLKHHQNTKSISSKSPDNEKETSIPVTEEDKLNRKLARIDKKMKCLSAKIKKLETAEVDFDDEDNSSFLLWTRLKGQCIKLNDYYCELTNCSKDLGRPTQKKFIYQGSRYEELNEKVSRWVNRSKRFPDFTDILNLVRSETEASKLPLKSAGIHLQAQEIFEDVGRMLQNRRIRDDADCLHSYGDLDQSDPADHDPQLAAQLQANHKISTQNLQKVFQDFVDKEMEISCKEESKPSNQDSCTEEEEVNDSDDPKAHSNATTATYKNGVPESPSLDTPILANLLGSEDQHIPAINGDDDETDFTEDDIDLSKSPCHAQEQKCDIVNVKRRLSEEVIQVIPSAKRTRPYSPEVVQLD